MATEKLSAIDIRDAMPGRHGDGGGLWLEVDPPGGKDAPRRWVFRFMLQGRSREMGLGSLADYTAAEARENAREARKLLDLGIDPIEHRRNHRVANLLAQASVLTFKNCADSYVGAHRKTWSAVHARQWDQSLRDYILPKLGNLPVRLVDKAAVMRVVQPLWAGKTETGSRVRQRIESILSYATAGGYREGDNPAAWETIKHMLPKRSKVQPGQNYEAMPYQAAPAFMARLREREGVAARALEFAILCATRTDETLDAARSEINLKERLWIIPASHTKSGNEHRVPLSDRAVEIVKSLPTGSSYLFGGGGTKGRLAKSALLTFLRKRMKEPAATVHGFRSCFRTWGAERTGYPHELLETALAHTQPDAVVRAYQRSDMIEKRRHCMDAWANYLASPPVAATVTPIRSRV